MSNGGAGEQHPLGNYFCNETSSYIDKMNIFEYNVKNNIQRSYFYENYYYESR